MGGSVSLHGGADVVALAVRDDEQALLLGVGNGLRQRLHPRPAIHLIVGGLGLYGRHNVAEGVNQALVVGQQSRRGSLQVLAVLGEGLRLDVGGDVAELGVQTRDSGVLFFHDSFHEPVQ